jgi:hypothetical protein
MPAERPQSSLVAVVVSYKVYHYLVLQSQPTVLPPFQIRYITFDMYLDAKQFETEEVGA